jgi:hypothetical protein
MSGPSVTVTDPPDDLSAFPALSAGDTPATLFRIFHNRNRTTGALNSPWRFSSVPPGDCRFDIEAPEGTCSWSDRRYGCWVEVWRGTGVVDRADVTRRALFTGSPPALRLANPLARAARRLGVTGELSMIIPYDVPQAWAQALRSAGFAGLVGICRHDPSLTARNVAIFGPTGVTARRTGWTVRRSAVLDDRQLAAERAELGVHVAAVPYVVPITPPVTP